MKTYKFWLLTVTQASLFQTVHKKDNVAPEILDMSIFVSRDRHTLTKMKQYDTCAGTTQWISWHTVQEHQLLCTRKRWRTDHSMNLQKNPMSCFLFAAWSFLLLSCYMLFVTWNNYLLLDTCCLLLFVASCCLRTFLIIRIPDFQVINSTLKLADLPADLPDYQTWFPWTQNRPRRCRQPK